MQHNYIEENVIDLDEVSAGEGRLGWRRGGSFPLGTGPEVSISPEGSVLQSPGTYEQRGAA